MNYDMSSILKTRNLKKHYKIRGYGGVHTPLILKLMNWPISLNITPQKEDIKTLTGHESVN